MVVTKNISLQTKGECDIIDITPQVEQQITETDISNGMVTLFVAGSTTGITTIEFESGVLSDFQSIWERNIPQNICATQHLYLLALRLKRVLKDKP